MWLGCFGVSLIFWDAHSGSAGDPLDRAACWLPQCAGWAVVCSWHPSHHPTSPAGARHLQAMCRREEGWLLLGAPASVPGGPKSWGPLSPVSWHPRRHPNTPRLCKTWDILSSSLAIPPTLDPLEVAGGLLRVSHDVPVGWRGRKLTRWSRARESFLAVSSSLQRLPCCRRWPRAGWKAGGGLCEPFPAIPQPGIHRLCAVQEANASWGPDTATSVGCRGKPDSSPAGESETRTCKQSWPSHARTCDRYRRDRLEPQPGAGGIHTSARGMNKSWNGPCSEASLGWGGCGRIPAISMFPFCYSYPTGSF